MNSDVKFKVTSSFHDFIRSLPNGEEITNQIIHKSCKAGIDYPLEVKNTNNLLSDSQLNHLNSLDWGRNIRLGKADRFYVLCWQWYQGNEFTLLLSKQSENEFLAYCYDPYWLRTMITMEWEDSETFKFKYNFTVNKHILDSQVYVGGWTNPSHFFGQFFPIYEILFENKQLISDRGITAFRQPNWQWKFIDNNFRILSDSDNSKTIVELGGYQANFGQIALLEFHNSIFFEDIPQWLGFKYSRAFFRRKYKEENDNRKKDTLIYLSRVMHERNITKENNDSYYRVADYNKICKSVNDLGGMIVFPELHSIDNMQRLLMHANNIILDPKSCHIHALLHPLALQQNMFQLYDSEHFRNDSWPSHRTFEWFAPYFNNRFEFCVGEEPNALVKNTYSSIRQRVYFDSINEKLLANLQFI